MNFERKRRIVYAALLIFALWPLMQMQLVRFAGVSPWKLAGWGMYAAPTRSIAIDMQVLEAGQWRELPYLALPEHLQRSYVDFGMSRKALGRLRSPEDFARRLLEAYPTATEVSLMIRRKGLDAQALIEWRGQEYRYRREELF